MKTVLLTLLAIACLCMAGSESYWFPWINLASGFVFLAIGIQAQKRLS